MPLFIGILLILIDMLVNSTQHSNVEFIVLFNAGLIFFILLVDLVNSTVKRLRRNYRTGKGIYDMYRHEHPSG